jgi:hypothetical protein
VGQAVQGGVGGPLRVDREVEPGQRIEPVAVAAELGDQHPRLERAQQRRDDRVEGAQPAGVPGVWRQRDVDRCAFRRAVPHVVREAGAGEGGVPGLVEADRQDPRIGGERRLDTVAVVGVHVDVRDPRHALGQQPGDRDRGVVVDAEAGRPAGHRVVQAAGQVDRVPGVSGQHGAGGVDRAAGDHGRGLVHPVEDRVVGAAQPVRRERRVGGIARRPPDGRDVVGLVYQPQHVVGGGAGRRETYPIEDAEVAGQGKGQLQPARCQRVGGSQVVLEEVVTPDDQNGIAHDGASLRSAPP